MTVGSKGQDHPAESATTGLYRGAIWEKWEHAGEVKHWEAVSLSLDIEPELVGALDSRFSNLEIVHGTTRCTAQAHPGFRGRWEGMCGSPELTLGGRGGKIPLSEFARWARCAGWDLPDVMVQLGANPPIRREHWLQQERWNEHELVDMLCGLEPYEWRPCLRTAKEAEEQIRRAIAAKALAATQSKGDYIAPTYWLITPRDAIAWATEKVGRFPDFPFSRDDLPSPTSADTRWPWGDYETRLLRLLAETARKWWVNYDPTDPTTAPRTEDVVSWLREQSADPPVSRNEASAIAKVLRADGLRPGRRG